jgi:filamentous hemagglutinin
MNKNLFRLVFNAARGQVVAVSEIASSHSGGKSASAEESKENHPLAQIDIAQAAIKFIVAAVAMLVAPAWLPTAVWAQAVPATTIVVNGAAPANQQPVVTTTASGITQVNIQTAVGGVSRNHYTQFDVGSTGLILNNSPVNSNTRLGGWVAGNTNLASGSANIILNEVNSTNPSQLRGYIEVAGQRAEVVIANPAGIVVNGGGFINASGATLTTGTPQFSGNSLTGYQVNGGTITVTGTGLDTATTGITTLQAQKIILQGGVFAQDLRVTGDNSAGTANAVAIDVSALGGMYANKITILATGQGAGVNNAGKLQANSGSFTLSADGLLTNTGTINSTATTRINADTVNNSTGGAIYGGSVAIAATTLNNAAATSTSTAPVIAARDSAGRVDIGVQTLNNQEGALIYSAGAMAIGGALDANGQATGRATTVTNNSATLEAAGNIGITTATLANTYTSLGAEAVVDTSRSNSGSIDCGVDCTHTWVDTFYKAVAITGPNGAAVIRSGADIALDASTSATNSSSQILAAGTLSTTGATLDSHGIDLTDTVRTHRNHTVVVTYMQNGIGCNDFGFDCHSERRYRTSTSTDYIADNQTIGPAVAQNRSTTPSTTTLPNSALFATSSNASYLVETNPAFTNRQIWLSSDYMLSALSVDPDITQKRMGDGFYEQRLINEQVARLTGYARLANYSSDEQQYQALMSSGITAAKSLQLRVGIALTAEQVAQLTSDIVWLVQQEVTLQDGSKQKVLVPQVYAVARSGDLASNGALLSGNNVNFNTTGDFSNANGTIQGRELLSLTATNVRNLAGRIEGKAVALNATQDIENIGGAVIARDALQLQAGRDIKVQTTTLQSRSGAGGASLQTRSTDISRVAGLYVTGDSGTLLASAGRDVQLTAAVLQSQGSTTVNAGSNLTLDTVTTSASMDATKDADNYNRTSRSAEVGTNLQSKGNTTLTAGQDLKARAANVQAAGDLNVTAGNNVVIESGVATSSVASASKTSNSGFMSSSTRTERSSQSSTETIASNFSGNNVTAISQNDLTIKGSNVSAVQNATLMAVNNVNLEAAQNSQSSSRFSHVSETGLSVDIQNGPGVTTSEDAKKGKSTTTTDVGSTVRSGRNLTVAAGNSIGGTAATLSAGGTATLSAQGNIVLQEGRTIHSADQQHSRNDQRIFSGIDNQKRATQDRSTAVASSVSGAQGVTMQANQGTLYLSAVNIDSSAGNVSLSGSDVIITSALNSTSQTFEEKTSRSGITTNDMMATFQPGDGLGHERKDTADNSNTTLAKGSISGQNIRITSTGGADSQLALRAVDVTATGTPATPGTVTLDAGAGTVKLQTIQTTDMHAVSMTESDIAWQGTSGSGTQTQSTAHTKIDGQLTTTAGRVQVEGSHTSLQEAASQLATQPGMAWLGQLQNDPQLAGKVDWNKVEEIHKNWHYDQAGLTPAGAAILTIVVTCITSGMGTTAVGGTAATAGSATTAASAATVMGSTALAAAVNVGFSALASQAAVALVNNQGDLGKTLDQLGKEENIKNLLLTMVTAGALDKLNSTMGWQNVGAQSTFGQQFQRNLTNNLASDMMNSVLAGRPFDEKTFANSLQGALINTGMAQGAFAIGDAKDQKILNDFTYKVAHAALGCIGGAAIAGDGSGCASGAVGAVVGEMAAAYYTDKITQGDPTRELTDKERADVVAFAKVMAATSGVISGGGGNNAAAVNIAATLGANAAENNYLTHAQAAAKKAALEKAKTEQEKRNITEIYDKLDKQQKNEAAACLLKDQCSSVFEKPSLEATLKELNAACAAPRLCTPEEQKSILELKDFYARRDSIETFTGIEEFLALNKGVGGAVLIARTVIARFGAEAATVVAKPLGVVSDFGGNPVAVLEAASQYAFKTEVNIGATGVNLENSAAQFVKDEAGKDFIGVFASKTGNNNGIDLAYAKMVNGQPQLVIGEAKAGDSALTALGENQANILRRNLEVVRSSINDIANDDIRRALLIQLDQRTYQVELYTSVGNAAKAAARVDDTLIARMGQPVSRIVTFGKN